jgi:hypothetical protein
MLGTLLGEAEPIAVDGRVVTVRPGNAGHAEGLERQRDAIAQLLGRFISEAPLVKIAAGQGSDGPAGPGRGGSGAGAPPRTERMTEERAAAERLRSLRAKDPTLSAAVDALDLELLE